MGKRSMSTLKLLIVDDSGVTRRRIARLALSKPKQRFEIVGEAGDGETALALARELCPDLVTMDLTMPVLDGVGCTRELCVALPNVRVLVISALAARGMALKALAAGAHGFLYKPFTDAQFAQWMDEVVTP